MRRRPQRPRSSLGVVDPRVWAITVEDVLHDLDPDWQSWHAVEDVRRTR